MKQPARDPALTTAIENAYRVFAPYKPGAILATCRCDRCMNEEIERLLLTTPLRKIRYRLLAEYTWSAAGGSGDWPHDPNELRYFLPRYFELIACGLNPCFSAPEPTLRQLGNIRNRQTWPRAEVEAIDEFFTERLRRDLNGPIQFHVTERGEPRTISNILDHLCEAAYGGGDISALLAVWDDHQNVSTASHIAAAVENLERAYQLGLRSRDELGPFWSHFPDSAKLITLWLYRPQIADRLRDSVPPDASPELAALFAEAEAIVRKQHG